jgi:hypothetical protein
MKVLLAVGRGGRDALAMLDDQRVALLAALQNRRHCSRSPPAYCRP